MTLQARIEEYRLPLGRAHTDAHHSFTERRGLVLTLKDEQGKHGQGEAAPLPGYSPEALDQARDELRSALPRLAEDPPVDTAFEGVSPSVRFALETALLDLAARRAKQPLHALLRQRFALTAPLGRSPLALLIELLPGAEALRAARAAVSQGFGTLKLKVGRPGAFAQELQALELLRGELGASLRLRVDANRAFSTAEVKARLFALRAVSPELVEEPAPLSDWSGSGVPIALDESLRDPLVPPPRALKECGVRVLVLKPTVLGGLGACLGLSRAATEAGLGVVVSHALEGPVGRAALSELALSLGARDLAHGLGEPGRAFLEPHERPGLGIPRFHASEKAP